MVHALEMTRDLLKMDGLLIDIHPTGRPPLVEVRVSEKIHLAGIMHEKGDFQSYFQADEALAAVTGQGLFTLEREEQFPFLYHAATVAALEDYFENDWIDAILPEETSQRMAELMGEPGDGADNRREIVLREIVHIARFHPGGRPECK